MSVVVGYSPSPQGDAALDAAAAEARRRGTALVVAAHEYTDPDRGRRCATEPEVRDALGSGAGEGSAGLRFLSGEGQDIGDFLLRAAEEQGAELLVVGLRHKSPSGKLTIGASARRVVLESPCPVLAVKDKAAATA